MKEEKEIKIEKMVLNIEGEKVSLSIEQAKKLKKILDELFGKEIVKEVVHEHHYGWWYRPYYPNVPTWWNSGTVYCSSIAGNSGADLTKHSTGYQSAKCLNINI
jgi:hypothetical protein